MCENTSLKLLLYRMKQTVVFLNFRRSENFAVNYLKFKQEAKTVEYFVRTEQNITLLNSNSGHTQMA